MASAAYESWLERADVERAVIADVQPAERLVGFTKARSYADTIKARSGLEGYWRLGEQGYNRQVMALTPSSYWLMGESSGNLADSAGSITGTANGSPTYGVAGPISDGGTAIECNKNGFFDFGNVYGFNGTASFSGSIWVYATGVHATNFERIVNKRITEGGGIQGWNIIFRPQSDARPGHISFDRWLNGSATAAHSVNPIPLNQWVHVAWSYDGATMRLYIDGVLQGVGTASALSLTSNSASLRIGADESGASSGKFHGRVTRPFILSGRALSQAEVTALYAARTHTDSTTSAQAEDSSGNGHHGTFGAGPTLGASGALADGTPAVAFDGSNDFVRITHASALAPTSEITMEGWAWRSNWASFTADSRILSKTSGGGYQLGFNEGAFYPGGQVGALVRRNGAYGAVSASITGLSSGWHYFVATYDGRFTKLYIDGVLADTDDAGGAFAIQYAENNHLFLAAEAPGAGGTIPDPGSYFSGPLDELALYSRALSAAEIEEHYALRLAEASENTQAYTVDWPCYIQTDVVPGGVYRRLDAVRQNDAALTERASVALVEANLGSFYLDQSAGVLYVTSTTGSDPGLFAWVGAVFSLFFGTAPIDFVGGMLYEPRLTLSVPEIQAEQEAPLVGVKAWPGGDVDLLNADGFFDQLVRRFIWKNKAVSFYFGGPDLAFADWELITVMKIEDMSPGDAKCTFRLRSEQSRLDTILPLNTIGDVEYPDADEGLSGTYKPLLWGEVGDIPGLLVDATEGAQVYLVADGEEQSLYAVTAVRAVHQTTGASTTLVEGVDYTVDLDACTVTVTSLTYVAATYDIRIDAKGETGGAAGWLSTFGEVSKDLLLKIGASADGINDALFTAADGDAPQALGLWVREPKTAAEYLRVLEASVFGSVFVGNDGRWSALIWDSGYDADALRSLVDADFAKWEPDDKIESMFSRVYVKYNHRPAVDAYSVTTASSSEVLYGYEVEDTTTIVTALVSASHASRLAERYLLVAGTPSIEIEIEERGLTGMLLQPFDKVKVTRARAPSLTGSFVERVMEVLAIRKRFGPPAVSMRLGDLRGFGERIGRWVGSSAPDYDDATEAERSQSGFWSNSSGLVDPSDASTMNIKVWG